ncbi:MAG: LEVG family PEP-CTERM protein [Fischerella sp.]|nr:LEVG family PEP-CTERM protein [Fischerella sp.]
MPQPKFLGTIAGTVLGIGLAANMPAAHAGSIIPTTEGEIKTNLECLVPSKCIDTTSLGYKVTSLVFDFDNKLPKYGLSRLFVDNRSTNNIYKGQGLTIKFGTQDAGTNTALNQFWLRPVAIKEDGTLPEQGQLEVGRFLFEFDQKYEEITLDFFDIEDTGTGILQINGQQVNDKMLQPLTKNANNSTQRLTLTKVRSFVVQLGSGYTPKFQLTGDGVSLSAINTSKAVPEPGTTVGLGVLVVAGMFGLRQRKRTRQPG